MATQLIKFRGPKFKGESYTLLVTQDADGVPRQVKIGETILLNDAQQARFGAYLDLVPASDPDPPAPRENRDVNTFDKGAPYGVAGLDQYGYLDAPLGDGGKAFVQSIEPVGKAGVWIDTSPAATGVWQLDGLGGKKPIQTAIGRSFEYMESAGHSIGAGGGANRPGGVSGYDVNHDLGYTRRIARTMGMRLRDMAIGGAIACWPTVYDGGDGGYAHVLQNTPRQPLPFDQPKYPHAPLVHLYFGLNDLAVIGSNNLTPFKEAYRTIVASFKLAARYQDTDPSVAYTAGWLPYASTEANSGTQITYSTTVNDTITISVPATYDGRSSIDLFSQGNALATVGITVDGATQPDWSITTDMWCHDAGEKPNGYVKRLGAFPAGAHTIVIKLKSGKFSFDSWGIEAADGPTFLTPLPFRPTKYSLWQTWPHGATAPVNPMTDASIPPLKAAVQAIHAEFGSADFIEVDIDPLLNKNAAYFADDGAHPNNEGQRIIATACLAALAKRLPSSPPKWSGKTRRAWRKVGGPGGPSYMNGWIPGSAGVEFTVDELGFVHIRGDLKNPTLGSYGAVMFTLPNGFIPQNDVIATVPMAALWATVWITKATHATPGAVSLLIRPGATANAAVFLEGVAPWEAFI